jgi:hypothetical protein
MKMEPVSKMFVYLKSPNAALMPKDFTGSNARHTYRTAQLCQMEAENWDGEVILKLI